ncbi:hypothetical protein PVAND_000716 [Polypedilum vanderplanki]|uniref:Tetraspanin n=1 Tax=Polypedilum vanderplanki TaxID=319348 RepID=A0A9J6BKS9_POLVA|nr:hypothetical protein PVAND_000716 [Polypedilum vanderplanki]
MHIIVGILIVYLTIDGNHYTDLPILPSLTACGIVLILISLVGLYGSIKHDQVSLFFYMILSLCLFVVQFSIAASCLAINTHKEENFAEEDWNKSSDELKKEIETDFHCIGFNASSPNSCLPKIIEKINSTFKLSGSIAFAFSFTEMLAVLLTFRYRNQKKLHANAFL